MKPKNITRRKLLAAAVLLSAGQGFIPVQLSAFLGSIVTGQIALAREKSMAGVLKNQTARNFVQFNMYGAPSRYFFDHPLRPRDTDAFIPCVGLYNAITEINYDQPHLTKGAYKDVKINGFNMPHLWTNKVAKIKGGQRDMSELMSNMLMIRGCKMASDGHPINCERQVSPLSGEYSITGLVADNSAAYFPGISLGRSPANRAFKSPLQASNVEIPLESSNYASYLLEIFHKQSQASSNSQKNIETAVEDAVGFLKNYALSNQPGAELLYNERRRVEKLIRSGVKNFADAFDGLSEKYEDLFSRSLELSPIAGVTDRIIPGAKFPFEVSGNVSKPEALATHRPSAEGYLMNADMRDVFAKVKSENLAKSFALAEFTLSEGLSSSVLLAPPIHDRGNMLVNLSFRESMYNDDEVLVSFDEKRNVTQFKISDTTKPKLGARRNFVTDCHETGWLPNVLACNLFYRGMSACVLEFIDTLKSKKIAGGKTLFDETLFQYATEFERAPIHQGGGTQHNFLVCTTSLYSGVIKKPEIIGNIYVGHQVPEYSALPKGTIGTAAPCELLPNKIININNISSTLSEILRVPRIVPRAASLVEVKGDTLKTIIEPARNVSDDV